MDTKNNILRLSYYTQQLYGIIILCTLSYTPKGVGTIIVQNQKHVLILIHLPQWRQYNVPNYRVHYTTKMFLFRRNGSVRAKGNNYYIFCRLRWAAAAAVVRRPRDSAGNLSWPPDRGDDDDGGGVYYDLLFRRPLRAAETFAAYAPQPPHHLHRSFIVRHACT